jgi:hypothetical protein
VAYRIQQAVCSAYPPGIVTSYQLFLGRYRKILIQIRKPAASAIDESFLIPRQQPQSRSKDSMQNRQGSARWAHAGVIDGFPDY